VVIDCTGVFKTEAALAPYFAAGVKKVVVSAPVKDGDAANVVYGVNHDIYDPARHRIVTAASCTTNCLAPVVKVVHEASASATARSPRSMTSPTPRPSSTAPPRTCAARGRR
jgi:glyceraldehyde-3-phosphate dehydrogenase/erythrose-4-phosphate dehydrogenase